MDTKTDIGNFLLIDASSSNAVIVGRLDNCGNAWQGFAEEQTAALEGIFAAVENVSATPPAGFIFCSGPGSILGIRIAAMAIRAWLAVGIRVPVLAYQSLTLQAALIGRAFPQQKDFAVLAESRMNCWNALTVSNGVPEKRFQELKSAELAETLPDRVFLLPQRRPVVPPLRIPAEPINPGRLLHNDPAVFNNLPTLLSDCRNAPDAINTSAADSYVKWSPERHRGIPATSL